jgi:hypothetical protein
MKTDELIAALAADTRPGPTVAQRLARVLPLAAAVAVAGFGLFWGVRPDLAAALASPAVLKSLLPLGLAALAGALALRLSRPEARGGRSAVALGAFGAALLAAFAVALVAGGLSGLAGALATPSLITCLTSIPLLALPLLGAALWALSAGASRRPALSGALGGLVAGGLAAGLYSLYCNQDSALFFLPAYATAILTVTLIGMLVGSRALAW